MEEPRTLNRLVGEVERWKHAMPVDASDLVTEVIDAFDSKIARLNHEIASARRAHRYWYENNRLLENRIRKAVKECFAAPTPDVAQDACGDLLRIIPKKPRPTWRQLIAGRRR